MKVANGIENLPQVSQTVASAPSARPSANAQIEGLNTDKAQLSVAASQAAQSSSESDVRLDMVARIQKALNAGTYSVPASAVAEKLIGSLLAPEK